MTPDNNKEIFNVSSDNRVGIFREKSDTRRV